MPMLVSAVLLHSGCRDEKQILAEKAAAKETEDIAAARRSAQLEELKFKENLRKERMIQIEATKKLIAELEEPLIAEKAETKGQILIKLGLWDGDSSTWMAMMLSRDNTMERLDSAVERYLRDKSAERRKVREERVKSLESARVRLVQLLGYQDKEPVPEKTTKLK